MICLRSLSELDDFNSLLNRRLTFWEFSRELACVLELVAEEVIVNIFTHSECPSGPLEVEVTVENADDKVILVFSDNGVAYDPLANGQVEGWGVPILKALVNEHHYTRQDGRNKLTLIRGEMVGAVVDVSQGPKRIGGKMGLSVEVYTGESGKVKIELGGRLDTNTAIQLEKKLGTLKPAEFPIQSLDLALLEYMSSAGLRCIFKARKDVVCEGGSFLLVNPQPQVRKVFEIIKALPVDELFSSIQELDDYLEKMQRQTLK